jgi:uncharacterized membrane protein YeaQ/YmgE (transglycosylase-associated protein family)
VSGDAALGETTTSTAPHLSVPAVDPENGEARQCGSNTRRDRALTGRCNAGTVRRSRDAWLPPREWRRTRNRDIPLLGMEVRMNIIAWIVLGAIAGYLAGFLVKGDEGLGVIGHIVLGIVGALVGGFLAGVLFNSHPIDGPFDLSSIVVSVIGAIITVVVVNAVTGRSRTGRGAI